jgi:hypothetical protein
MRRRLIALMTIASFTLIASEAWAAKSQPIKRVSESSLKQSCEAAGGSSWSTGGGYGCTKDNCDGKGGTCGVQCGKSGCTGVTPIRSPKGATVGGVLGQQPGATATRNPPPPPNSNATGRRVVNPTQTLQPKSKSQSEPQNVSGADRGARSEGRGSSRR